MKEKFPRIKRLQKILDDVKHLDSIEIEWLILRLKEREYISARAREYVDAAARGQM